MSLKYEPSLEQVMWLMFDAAPFRCNGFSQVSSFFAQAASGGGAHSEDRVLHGPASGEKGSKGMN